MNAPLQSNARRRAALPDTRLAWALMLPALGTICLVALFPIGWTFWESLHLHDLRMPWLGRPWVGASNYVEALSDPRFLSAVGHTLFFTTASVTLELTGGLAMALVLDRVRRWKGLVRSAALLPWAIPTVVVALIWRFVFETPAGIVAQLLSSAGIAGPDWFADATAAWVPVILADVWKTTPFVAVLLLGGLQAIDRELYDAARIDGAGWWRQLTEVTLPLLRPALLVAFVFRTLDAFRVFDAVYVLTAGGPGTATEPIALYTFSSLLRNLRFGFGAALSMMAFGAAFVFALLTVRFLGGVVSAERSA